jgi:hypothetical protein
MVPSSDRALVHIKGEKWDAHRFVFKHLNGRLPVIVLQTCGNRRCVNPAHLKEATRTDVNKRTRVEMLARQEQEPRRPCLM